MLGLPDVRHAVPRIPTLRLVPEMIQQFNLLNFKGFRTLALRLRPFGVLIGPNSVGKSSVLKALSLACRLGAVTDYGNDNRAPFNVVFSDENAAGRLVRQPDASTFNIDLELEGEAYFGFAVALKKGEIAAATATLGGPDGKIAQSFPDPSVTGNPRNFFLDPLFAKLASTRLLRLDAEAVARPALVPAGKPRLQDNGAGLAAVLQAMHAQRDGSLERVEAALRIVVPTFHRARFVPTELAWMENDALTVNGTLLDRLVKKSGAGVVLELEFKRGGWIPAAQVSEGTLLALALLTVVHGPDRPRLLLLDDVDRGLHPQAQVELLRLLRNLQAENSDLQIICTAHSPMVVAGCAADEVIHLEFDSDGYPAVKAPTGDPPWMTPSEIMADYFGIDQLGLAETMQRYGMLAGDPRRSDEEDVEVRQLRKTLKQAGADPGWEPVRRAQVANRRRSQG